ncbi:hypothetical protein [Actinokineospora globicatena]|uniref:hypothetical protein n=1 Tax=Actinokineospora globicatena TaxID=103729 RepID=UPI0020A41A8A|nr:hypothetical protein [Actinokineospora globicatena]MCP2301494.1 PGAP1-like protein [Actinokineospora globicatena]GLW76859.1 hypothetical protein Aglo01_13410 [Actinokineospora globicatena]GLW83692.1 hypothetical protein Aglo02_13320 [Actinokineospora globicatena]
MSNPVTNLTVGGGAGGTEAFYEDLAAMGDLTDDIAGETLGIAVTSHRYLADPDLLASAVLNPVGAAQFEFAMLGALDGPSGLTATSAGIGLRGIAFQATNQAYHLADDLNAKALEAGRWLAGAAAVTVPGVAIGAGAFIGADILINYDGDWQRWLVEHPGMVDDLLGMTPGALSALGLPTDLATLTDLVAATYPDGDPVVTHVRTDEHPIATDPPDNLAELFNGLDHRNGTEANIDIRRVTQADGTVAYIVDIPGTRVWNAPFTDDQGSANDMGTNVDAIAGNPTVLQEGIQQALIQAQVPKDAPLMLVGHSQGGIVAARSVDPLLASGYNITHVVTAGSPVGGIPIDERVQMLSLENNGDIVPHLDAAENPNSDNRTTVKFDNQTGTAGGNHAINGNYTEAARQLDSSTDPSIVRFRDGASVFFGGQSVVTEEYSVVRQK